MTSITLTNEEIRKGTLAAATLGKGVSTEADAREGFAVIARALEAKAPVADLFGLGKNKVTLAKAVILLTSVVPTDAPDAGFTAITTQVNYLSALSMSPMATATQVVEANPKVGTFVELNAILADITGEGATGKKAKGQKDPRTIEQDIAALVKRVTVVAETHDTNEAAIVQAVWTALKASKAAAEEKAAA